MSTTPTTNQERNQLVNRALSAASAFVHETKEQEDVAEDLENATGTYNEMCEAIDDLEYFERHNIDSKSSQP